MHTLLITITTTQHSTDLEVPAEVPIGQLMPKLLELCGSQPLNVALEKWHLRLSNATTPLQANESLLEAGVKDGAILLLQDMTPVVGAPQQQHEEESFAPKDISPSEQTGGIGIRWGAKD